MVQDISVSDLRAHRLNIVKRMLPSARVHADYHTIISDPAVDAVVIATPTSTHFEIASFALQNDKHVLIEKPVTSSSQEAAALADLAQRNNKVIVVDHTFLYNGAVQHIKATLEQGLAGNINYIDCTRINLGIYQPDVNVIWDLASHDISVVNYLLQERPIQVRAIGKYNVLHNKVDMAYIFLHYQSGLIIQINCSWISPVKIRQMIIGGSEKMIIYDDIEPTHKLKIYEYMRVDDMEDTKNQLLIDYRLGAVIIPKFKIEEPLKMVINDFLHCIVSGSRPVSGINEAIEVVKIIEGAELSLQKNGALIPL